jgi:hypothetical protein
MLITVICYQALQGCLQPAELCFSFRMPMSGRLFTHEYPSAAARIPAVLRQLSCNMLLPPFCHCYVHMTAALQAAPQPVAATAGAACSLPTAVVSNC